MIDLNLIRQNPTDLFRRLATRGMQYPKEKIITLDKDIRTLKDKIERLKQSRNTLSFRVSQLKSQTQPADNEIAQVKLVKEDIQALEEVLIRTQEELHEILANIPNIPLNSVPVGKDESENQEIYRVGDIPHMDTVKPHYELLASYINTYMATEMSGTRFTVLQGELSRLYRALGAFMLDVQRKNGFTEMYVPYILHKSALYNTGQLSNLESDMYEVDQAQYLLPTAEVPLVNLGANKLFKPKELPLLYTALTPCFRREAGAAGRDTRGLIRLHQFHKVEMVVLCVADEAEMFFEKLVQYAGNILTLLGLPYRVLALCTGDLGFAAAKTYDLEVWMPSQNRYVEISSCSNDTDFQARRMKSRVKNQNGKNQLIYTLNGSGLAVDRTLAALVENHQQPDGSVRIPEALRPYYQNEIFR